MDILFITLDGSIVPIVKRIKDKEGLDVKVCSLSNYRYLEGLVDYVDSIQAGIKDKPKCIVFDFNGKGELADKLRKAGYKVVGGGVMNDRLEYDRLFGLKLMEMCGIKTAKRYEFNNIREVKKFLEKDSGEVVYVLKPFGDKPNFLTFLPSSNEELKIYVDWLTTNELGRGRWLLQEKIEGYEISTEVWFSQGKMLYRANYTLETKRRDVNDLGPMVGASTSVVFGAYKDEPIIVQKVFKKLLLLMEKVKYTGVLDINCIVNDKGIYGLEWTPRLGWNAMFAELEVLEIPPGELFIKVAEGSIDRLRYKEGYGYALRVVLPEYPSEDKNIYKQYKGMPVFYLPEYKDNIWFLGVRLGRHSIEVDTLDGIVAEISSYGRTMEEAEHKAIEVLNGLYIPNKTARVGDGAKHALKRYNGLKKLGFWF